MAKGIKIDIAENAIIVSKSIEKKASKIGSTEYKEFQKIKAENAGYDVVVREIKKNTSKKTYAGLTYDYMRSYIMTHEDRKNIIPVLHELDELIMISQCHSKGYKYPVIKNWFLERYAEIKEYGMEPIEQADVPSIESICSEKIA